MYADPSRTLIERQVTEAKTVQGSSVRVSLSEGSVKIDNAKVVSADIAASNGIIHVIGACRVARCVSCGPRPISDYQPP